MGLRTREMLLLLLLLLLVSNGSILVRFECKSIFPRNNHSEQDFFQLSNGN